MTANKERRQNRRYDLSLPIEIETPNGPGARVLGTTQDVSTRGVYFLTRKLFEVGDPLTFVLSLPSEITQGGVVRIKGYGKVLRVNTAGGVSASIESYEFLPQ